MKKLNLLVVVAIALSAATMLYLAKTVAAQGPDVCTAGSTPNSCVVKISLDTNGNVVVDPPSLSISKSENQTVQWKCVDTHPCVWTVIFKGKGPFDQNFFYNKHSNSGKARTDVPADKNHPYPYSVVINGDQKVDPQIIIK